MKKNLTHYLKNKKILAGIIVLVIIIIIIILSSDGNSYLETAIAKRATITEKINVTGKVTPFKKAELGFEKGGVVSRINYKVGDLVKTGDIIVELESTDANASLESSVAGLLAERAKLNQVQNGLRPEELSVEEAKLHSAEITFEDARTTLINALHDSYVKTENAIYNYADNFFTNPQTVVPKINLRTDSYNEENKINQSRLLANENLKVWKKNLEGMTLTSDPIAYLDGAHKSLEIVKNFMSQLSTIVSNLTVGNSGMSQTTIDSYNLIMNTALSTFNTAVGSLASAESTYRTASTSLALARDQFHLKKVGSSEDEIQTQIAKVEQANANVLSSRAELNKKRLIAPIDGIVTKIVPELGEFASIGVVSATVMSDVFKIEVNIPESDISKVMIGNPASITLDAYDNSIIFNAHVISIDPAETIVEGIPTYKTTLQFDEKDARIRSGMTANIDILTNTVTDAISVPYRALIDKSGDKYIRVVDSDGSDYTEKKVKVGIRGGNGDVEIIDGINEGDTVVTATK